MAGRCAFPPNNPIACSKFGREIGSSAAISTDQAALPQDEYAHFESAGMPVDTLNLQVTPSPEPTPAASPRLTGRRRGTAKTACCRRKGLPPGRSWRLRRGSSEGSRHRLHHPASQRYVRLHTTGNRDARADSSPQYCSSPRTRCSRNGRCFRVPVGTGAGPGSRKSR